MFKISFVPADFQRIIRATHREEATAEVQVNSMQFRCSTEFLGFFRSNIMTQRYSSRYARLNPKYRIWKEQYGRSGLEFWSLMGDLVRSLRREREGTKTRKVSAFFVGVPRGAMDSGGKSWLGKGDYGPRKPINFYALIGEQGRPGQPARPILQPSVDEFTKSGGKWEWEGLKSLEFLFKAWS